MRIIMLAVLCVLVACEPGRKTTNTPGSGTLEDVRIVSLSPAISRTLIDFGFEDRIVGRTPFCASLDQSIPVVGSLLDLDYERLLQLNPTHVLVQPSLAKGVEPKLRDLATRHGWILGEFPGLNTIDDVEAMILQLPGLICGGLDDDVRNKASSKAAELSVLIADALTPVGPEAWHGTTLLVESVDPVLVFGNETYLSDLLTALGGDNAAHVNGWAELSLEDVTRLDPEAIILVREKPIAGDDALREAGPLAGLSIRAVRDGRIAALVHPDVNLPSSGVIGVASALRDVLMELGYARPAEVER